MNLEETERQKYEKVWSFKDYSDNSPGERLVPFFLSHAVWQPGQTLIDLGCGTGRAGARLSRAGFDVTLLDHVKAVEAGIELPFMLANLWKLPPVKNGFHWFYCCDVLEHIPPEKVDAVLENCRKIALQGFFQIALFDDEWHGEKLHLTVEKSEWWISKLAEHWKSVTAYEPEKYRIAAIVDWRNYD